ncbi:MAG: RHS repeat-associated protein, partial [Chlamydiales bacterium]
RSLEGFKLKKSSSNTLSELYIEGFMRYFPQKMINYPASRPYPAGEMYCVTKVSSSDAPQRNYQYERLPGLQRKVSKVSGPDNRYQQIEYYALNTANPVQEMDIRISNAADFRLGRVRRILEPRGGGTEPLVVASFIYHETPGSKAGFTEVYDALSNKTIYHFTEGQRLNSIEKYEKSGRKYHLYSKDKFFWGDPVSKDEGNILSRTKEDSSGNILLCKSFTYDNHGNVLEEKLFGNLSGNNNNPVILDSKGAVSSKKHSDSYSTKYSYSNDDFNHMLSKQEANGKNTHYSYKAQTQLVTKKFICEGQQLRKRYFYEYDENGILVKSIEDDNSVSEDSGNLQKTTERRKTIIHPRTSSPGMGLPEWEEEYYYDFHKKKVTLLKKTLNTYGERDRLASRSFFDANGKKQYTTTYSYNEKGWLTKEADSRGKTWIHHYDANGNKTSSISPAGIETTFTYDFSNQLLSEQEKSKEGTFIKKIRYDLNGNILSSEDTYGNETHYSYDSFGRIVKLSLPALSHETKRALRPEMLYDYDIFNNQTSVTDPKGYRTETQYTLRGEPSRIQYPDSTVEEFEYYPNGTLKKKTEKDSSYSLYQRDWQGKATEVNTYSSKNRHLKVEKATYSAFQILTSVDGEGQITQYQYDGAGRIIEESVEEKKTSYSYDPMGNCHKIITHHGNNATENIIAYKEFDIFGRLIAESLENGQNQLMRKSNYEYDINDNRTKVIKFLESGPSIENTLYNSRNEKVSISDPLGNTTRIVYKYTHQNTLGQRSRSVTVTDPNGYIAQTTVDGLGNIESLCKRNPAGKIVDKKTFYYDGNGNKTRENHEVYAASSKLYDVTSLWQYGPEDRLEKLIEAYGCKEQKITTYSYNRSGQLWRTNKPNGVSLSRTYDAFGRLESIQSSDGSIHDSYSYNREDKLLSIEDHVNKRKTLRSYDKYYRLIGETLDNGIPINFSYDHMDRCRSMNLSDASSVEYLYDGINPKEIIRKNSSGSEIYRHSFVQHDLCGNTSKEKLILNTGERITKRDKLGRCASLESTHHAWTIPKNGFDAAGNLKEITVTDGLGSYTGAFSYDDNYHLSSESGALTNTYQFDSRDNRLRKNTDNYSHNRIDSLLNDGKASYTYDSCGNLLSKKIGSKEIKYAYDAYDRLLSVKEEENLFVSYQYDGTHRRTGKKVFIWDSGSSSWLEKSHLRFLYNGELEIGSVGENGEILEFRTLNNKNSDIGASVAVELEGKVYLPIHDYRGSVAALVDPDTNEIMECFRYSAFGEELIYDNEGIRIDSSQLGNPWRYSNKRVDDEMGLVFFGKRYYAPSIGRWITPDPTGFADGPNLYAYVHNKPLTLFDPQGLASFKTNPDLFQKYTELGKYETTLNQKELQYVVDYASRDLGRYEFVTDGYELSRGIVSIGNGMWNCKSESMESGQHLSNLGHGCKVMGVYNDSRGPGALKLFTEYLGYKTNGVMNLRTMFCRGYLDLAPVRAEGHETGHFHRSHSQNGIETVGALRPLPKAVQDHIKVVNVNAGRIVPGHICGDSLNFRSSGDLVSLLDLIGLARFGDQVETIQRHEPGLFHDHVCDGLTMDGPVKFSLDTFFDKYL